MTPNFLTKWVRTCNNKDEEEKSRVETQQKSFGGPTLGSKAKKVKFEKQKTKVKSGKPYWLPGKLGMKR